MPETYSPQLPQDYLEECEKFFKSLTKEKEHRVQKISVEKIDIEEEIIHSTEKDRFDEVGLNEILEGTGREASNHEGNVIPILGIGIEDLEENENIVQKIMVALLAFYNF